MPANKNAMTRYALIDKMLANRNRCFSIQDITNALSEILPEFGQEPVSKRCVEKDLNYLEFDSPFDVSIEEYWIDANDCKDRPYKRRCIRYEDPTFSIFRPKLTEDEKNILATALDTLGEFNGLENFEWLNDLKHRLNIEDRDPIISISKNILSNSSLIAQLFTSIRQKQVITLNYHTFIEATIKSIAVTPYLIKEYNNRWFLIASACDTGKVLTFPLDRIDNYSLNYIDRYIEKPADIIDRFEDIIGMYYPESGTLETITFWVSDLSKDYICTKPIHGSQKILKGENEIKLRKDNPTLGSGIFIQIECIENYELIRELCSFGPELIVISPLNIQNKIKERLSKMIDSYNTI